MVTLCRELNKTTFVMFTVNINFNLMGSLSFFLFLFLPFAWCLSLITLVQIWLMWALQIEIGLIMKIMFNTIFEKSFMTSKAEILKWERLTNYSQPSPLFISLKFKITPYPWNRYSSFTYWILQCCNIMFFTHLTLTSVILSIW